MVQAQGEASVLQQMPYDIKKTLGCSRYCYTAMTALTVMKTAAASGLRNYHHHPTFLSIIIIIVITLAGLGASSSRRRGATGTRTGNLSSGMQAAGFMPCQCGKISR